MAEGTMATHGETPEQWRPVPCWPGYEASDQLRIGSHWKRGRGGLCATRTALKASNGQVWARPRGGPPVRVKVRYLVFLAWGEEVAGLLGHARNKLNPDGVREAARLKAEGVPYHLIAKRLGVSRTTAKSAATGRTYRHLNRPAG